MCDYVLVCMQWGESSAESRMGFRAERGGGARRLLRQLYNDL